jgi:hypothetical protein
LLVRLILGKLSHHPSEWRIANRRRKRRLFDRFEVLLQIVRYGIDHAADVGVPLADVDRVAGGRGAGDAADRNAAASTADVSMMTG